MAETILTIGYQGAAVDTFWKTLVDDDVDCLIDVRAHAWSPRPLFSQNALRRNAEHRSIDYLHLPVLGIPSEERKAAISEEQRKALLSRYRLSLFGPRYSQFIWLCGYAWTARRPALLCCEADPNCCHRGQLAGALASQLGVTITHLQPGKRPSVAEGASETVAAEGHG